MPAVPASAPSTGNPELADFLLAQVVGELAPLELSEVELLRRERLRA